jgi:alpha-D-ribose 1-methylphosphonate 5-triphosphate synthase subunit PhnG
MVRAQATGREGAEAEIDRRQALMRACAHATEAELESALAMLGELPAVEELRTPEMGLVMLRGRIGANGKPFNVGETIVTRAAVRLAGRTGVSYLLGRCERRARLAAMLDALAQEVRYRASLQANLVVPVMARVAAEDARVRAQAAATKVDFFTLVRGED